MQQGPGDVRTIPPGYGNPLGCEANVQSAAMMARAL